MKEKVSRLVNDSIKELNVFVDDAFISTEEGKKIFNIVLDSDEVIDLNYYSSLDEFIYERMEICDNIKNQSKVAFYKTLVETSDGVVLPYPDLELARILSVKR